MASQDPSTEQKIKETARELFHRKGYEGTKTRDIAEAAGINIALMNYYFRSKRKLFELIMLETVETFFKSIFEILNDESTTLDQKLSTLSNHYIGMLQKEPDLPIFIVSELRNNSTDFMANVLGNKDLQNSSFFRQLMDQFGARNRPPLHPGHFLMNFIALNVFPFVARPVITSLFHMDDHQFNAIMEERKELIPFWMKQLKETSDQKPR